MKLTPPQLSRLAALLDHAIDLTNHARDEWLDKLAEPDAEVHRVLASLFEKERQSADFTIGLSDLHEPQVYAARQGGSDARDVAPGERFGAWRMDRLLGTGGMGQVWLALRDDGRYDGRAAVKLVRSFASDAARRRFETEGKLLARLEHPNIARLLDAGERNDVDRSAYLILEYVDGVQIDLWADQCCLSVQSRLKIFLQVCAALSYAHANLVVHRDIKPSNILVQANGHVKLLDFGVAKLIADEHANDLTIEAGVALTPEYASPEQIDGKTVSVATDVYSLGVLLFWLLAGVPPYDVTQPTRMQLLRAILGEVPRRLSTASDTRSRDRSVDAATRTSTSGGDAALAADIEPQRIAELRGTTPERLERALNGDLDTVVAKALKKLPNERYATVQAFADDIQRHLNHQPILARADSWSYRARKFTRRNWIALSAAAAVAVVTTGGVILTLWQANQVMSEAARANATKDFLIGVLSASDTRVANDKPRGQMTARELLDVSAAKIEPDFAAYPETQHDLFRYFAEIYGGLAENKRYDEMRERQRVVIAKHYSPLSVQAIEWTLARVNRVCNAAEPAACEAILATADDQIIRAGKDDSALRADWLRHKARFIQEKPNTAPEREAALIKAATLLEKHEPRSRRLVTAIADLGVAYSDQLEYPKAIEQYQRALRVSQSVLSPNVNEIATIHSNLGLAYSSSSQFEKAIETLRTASDLMAKTGGATDPTSWSLQEHLAKVYARTGQREAALKVFTDLLPNLPPAATPHPEADRARNSYADMLVHEGRAAEAIPILEEIQRHYLANVQYEFLLRSLRWSLGWAYQAVGRFNDAQRSLKAALDEAIAREKPESQMVLALRESYGNLLFEMRDVESAAAQFSEVVARADNRKLTHIALAHGGLARVAAARNQTEIALTESAKALDIWANKKGFSNGRMEPRLQRMRADALAAAGRIAEAQKFEDDASRLSQKFDGPANPTTQRRIMRAPSPAVR